MECPYRDMIESNQNDDVDPVEGMESNQSLCQLNSTVLALLSDIIELCTTIESIELIGETEEMN